MFGRATIRLGIGPHSSYCFVIVEKISIYLSISHNVPRAEAYLRAKFHLDPSNRLATIHQRYRQTGQDRQTTV